MRCLSNKLITFIVISNGKLFKINLFCTCLSNQSELAPLHMLPSFLLFAQGLGAENRRDVARAHE